MLVLLGWVSMWECGWCEGPPAGGGANWRKKVQEPLPASIFTVLMQLKIVRHQ